MKALVFSDSLHMTDCPKPRCTTDEVLIKVAKAGICNTDIEITRGYMPGFNGIPGHEFIGYVEEADDRSLIGKRVTGEINCACGTCKFCNKGLGRHCPNRTVLGIDKKDGAFAEYLTLPEHNVVEIPADMSDDQALFLEPLAAALEILNQVTITNEHSVLLLGDGKLAMLIAMVMQKQTGNLLVVGKHAPKLQLLKDMGISTVMLSDFSPSQFDVVIEASGNPSAFHTGLSCVKPRGTFVLKSTYAQGFTFNPAGIVVNEITLVGSRCGIFRQAVDFIVRYNPLLTKLISATYPLSRAIEAFDYAQTPGTLKVIITMNA
jgi:threonine dehydrogenase-like Zn-dependent dehydrogenase